MSFTIDETTTKEELINKIKAKPKEELINKTKREIKDFEDEFGMKSADFYKKYINDELEYKEGYEEWCAKIKMLARYEEGNNG